MAAKKNTPTTSAKGQKEPEVDLEEEETEESEDDEDFEDDASDDEDDLDEDDDEDEDDGEETSSTSSVPAPSPSKPVPQMGDSWNRIGQIVVAQLDSMKDGEKTTLKTLAQLVSEQTGIKGTGILPVISLIVKGYSGVSIELGRFGGIYKGQRPSAMREPDTRQRCPSCKQVIRQKTGPRKKKEEQSN